MAPEHRRGSPPPLFSHCARVECGGGGGGGAPGSSAVLLPFRERRCRGGTAVGLACRRCGAPAAPCDSGCGAVVSPAGGAEAAVTDASYRRAFCGRCGLLNLLNDAHRHAVGLPPSAALEPRAALAASARACGGVAAYAAAKRHELAELAAARRRRNFPSPAEAADEAPGGGSRPRPAKRARRAEDAATPPDVTPLPMAQQPPSTAASPLQLETQHQQEPEPVVAAGLEDLDKADALCRWQLLLCAREEEHVGPDRRDTAFGAPQLAALRAALDALPRSPQPSFADRGGAVRAGSAGFVDVLKAAGSFVAGATTLRAAHARAAAAAAALRRCDADLASFASRGASTSRSVRAALAERAHRCAEDARAAAQEHRELPRAVNCALHTLLRRAFPPAELAASQNAEAAVDAEEEAAAVALAVSLLLRLFRAARAPTTDAVAAYGSVP